MPAAKTSSLESNSLRISLGDAEYAAEVRVTELVTMDVYSTLRHAAKFIGFSPSWGKNATV